MQHLFDVISETSDLLVINKPAGLVCHPTKGDVYSSLVSRARIYLPLEESPHLINRLDRETSGIVLVAKNADASARLRKLWETRAVVKEYVAIVHGAMEEPTVIDAPLGPDPESQVSIKDRVDVKGASATTHVYPVKTFRQTVRGGGVNGESGSGTFSLVRVVLLTGRKHQIRIHLAHVGHPIVGDKLYGGDENLYLSFVKDELTEEQRDRLITENQCLHAQHLSFELLGVTYQYFAPPEPWFCRFAGIE